MPRRVFEDRAVIHITGDDAESLLQNVITTDLDKLAQGEAQAGALLTPQGKILFDFVISRHGDKGFRLDARKDVAPDLLKRLTLYKLRAKAEISLSDQETVSAYWENDSDASTSDSSRCRDLRFGEAHVFRTYDLGATSSADEADWANRRIEHAVPESGNDFELGDAFPHDVLYDQGGGVGLRKGCYVGQEVVSRMHHRGTARRRLVKVNGDVLLPATGSPLLVGEREIGRLGTVSGTQGLAIVRTDRVADAAANGEAVTAGDATLSLSVPAYASFSLEKEPEA
ncbi:YgfZ/GcvT domain-containing protein [Nitratireductor basaltis]|uniref:Glycine cleavage T protein (Aminomethyl transferase) n=1 Tax=Nitratireductor basaltis TaxID=472175 RepID=A0A084UC90_9HYPH|nr:folate-binding protein YgfZ [Nitratireductor basaltis]KFB10576.1 Glycine cleavage T protein (Aminomethyl transferase) [Nitratireductor basaltis]